jgi:glycosyltransferase involved in cell wall biosynthesis
MPLPSRPYLLFVGERGGYKNFSQLLAAFHQATDVNIDHDIVAFGGGAKTAAEATEIARLGFTRKVHFLHGDDSALSEAYAHATALVYPSRYEGFGLPPVEAMHSGCPVVCSNASSIPEIVGEAGLYFDPLSVDELANALVQIVGSQSLRSTLSQKGQIRAAQFTWQSCAQRTLAVYQAILP